MGPNLGPEAPELLPALGVGIPGRKGGGKGGDPGGIRDGKGKPGMFSREFFPLFPDFPWFYPWINDPSLLRWQGLG